MFKSNYSLVRRLSFEFAITVQVSREDFVQTSV